jgi:hypothetical protein
LRREGFYIGVRKIVACFVQTAPDTKRQPPAGGIFSLVLGRERQKGNVSGLLDGASETALMLRTHAGQAAGNNLASFGHKPLQKTNISVRDGVDLLSAELANLLAAEKLATAAWTAARTSALTGRSARTALRWCAPFGRPNWCFICHVASSYQLSAVSHQPSVKAVVNSAGRYGQSLSP